ncbi:hypothetical protein [Myroides sp. LJL119]
MKIILIIALYLSNLLCSFIDIVFNNQANSVTTELIENNPEQSDNLTTYVTEEQNI